MRESEGPESTQGPTDVSQVLAAIQGGDPRAAEHLLPLVYYELRKLASQRIPMRGLAKRWARRLWSTRRICGWWAATMP